MKFKNVSSYSRVKSSVLRVASLNPRIKSLNPRVTSSDPRVASLNPWVQESFNQWKLKQTAIKFPYFLRS